VTARADPHVFPFPGHRTLAEVDRDERYQRSRDRATAATPSPKALEKTHADT